MPNNVCFETLLFPSNPICSTFQFSIDSSSGFAFSALSLSFIKIITKHNVGKKTRYSCDLSLVEHVEVWMW